MATTRFNLLLLSALVSSTLAAPTLPPSSPLSPPSAAPASSASFDQRQDGKLNVRVDLDNFVILFARPSSSSSLDLFGSVAQLLADSRHSIPVDLNQPQSSLQPSSTSENIPVDNNKPLEDVTVVEHETKSNNEPGLVLIQFPQHQSAEINAGGKIGRTSLERALKDFKVRPRAQQLLDEKYKRVEDLSDTQNLELVGAQEPGCGPERKRDASGRCEFSAAVVKQIVQPVVAQASEQL